MIYDPGYPGRDARDCGLCDGRHYEPGLLCRKCREGFVAAFGDAARACRRPMAGRRKRVSRSGEYASDQQENAIRAMEDQV